MMTKPEFQIVLWICLMSLSVFGQHSQRFEVHFCTHLCAHTRLNAPLIGIYNQDPRVHDYDVKFYGLDLDVVPWSTYLDGSVRILAEIVRPKTRYLVVELTDNLTVSEILWNGIPLAFQHFNDKIEIDLGEEKEKGTLVDIKIYYSGEPIVEGFFSGIRSAQNNFGDHVLWTLSEPHNARQWFPCKQVLSDKADSVYVFLTTPPGYMAASNGLLKNITPLSDGRLRHEWKSYYPIAFYLISMAVSNYQEYNFFAPLSDNNDSVFVQNFIYNYPQALELNKENLKQTKPMMQLFSQLWGDYPFAAEKYGHAHAPMGGAMEHQTMSTMGYFGFDITAHELAHHWFGNNVTCATWSDIWINEGFASYGEYLAREFIVGGESARQWMNAAHSNIKAVPDGSVFVPVMQLPDIWRIFNGRLTYRKGAAILHQLRFEINDDDRFFFIMEDFQNQYADSVASGDDFRKSIDYHTGQSWEWFFDQWYYGEGYPIYEITWWQKEDRLFIRSAQNTSSPLQDFFAGTLEFMIITDNDEEIPIRFFQQNVLQEFETTIHGVAEKLIFDPSGFMLKDYIILDSTQINNPDLLPFTIYPNPFSDHILIDYQDALHNSSVLISDLQGRMLHEERLIHPSQRINLVNLAQGIYLVSIISPAGGRQTVKVMKH